VIEVDTDIKNQIVTVFFDDSETNAEQMKAALNAKGYEVTEITYIYPNCNGTIEDVIKALQVIVNMHPANINLVSDAEGDGKIGLTDAICIMQKISVYRRVVKTD